MADICVFVEGTYPYVTGGVSAWLHNLISHLPEFSFAICHLGSRPEPDRKASYQFPPNVVGFQEVFLNSSTSIERPSTFQRSARRWQSVEAFHDALTRQRAEEEAELLRAICQPGPDRPAASDFLYAPNSWDFLVEQYKANAPSMPFLDYFWTFRSTHLPIHVLNDATFPQAKLYHTISTGYAGYAAASAALQTGEPLLLTEHGVYTRERDMELALATWMELASASGSYQSETHVRHLKIWWADMFRFMSRFTYHMSDCIVSITQINQQYQLRDGADPSKLRLIPNGIDISRFSHLRTRRRAASNCFTVGFVGRVVPIKDVKCFVQAIKIAAATIPGIRAFIIGPTDEAPDYFAECQELIALLELGEVVHFTGRANVLEYYAEMDVLVLTSLSEGQPLVILEANCAGIPVVASDVGACCHLVEGHTPEDRSLGPSGLITLPASPDQTAAAIVRLWKDEGLRRQMARAGQERVRRFYREDTVYAAYRDLYRQYIDSAQ
jgi:glycosyltransferase involved in cell wall biosynthesis